MPYIHTHTNKIQRTTT